MDTLSHMVIVEKLQLEHKANISEKLSRSKLRSESIITEKKVFSVTNFE